jgi:hypothetical protein
MELKGIMPTSNGLTCTAQVLSAEWSLCMQNAITPVNKFSHQRTNGTHFGLTALA